MVLMDWQVDFIVANLFKVFPSYVAPCDCFYAESGLIIFRLFCINVLTVCAARMFWSLRLWRAVCGL